VDNITNKLYSLGTTRDKEHDQDSSGKKPVDCLQYQHYFTVKLSYKKNVKVSRDRPRWPKGFRVG